MSSLGLVKGSQEELGLLNQSVFLKRQLLIGRPWRGITSENVIWSLVIWFVLPIVVT